MKEVFRKIGSSLFSFLILLAAHISMVICLIAAAGTIYSPFLSWSDALIFFVVAVMIELIYITRTSKNKASLKGNLLRSSCLVGIIAIMLTSSIYAFTVRADAPRSMFEEIVGSHKFELYTWETREIGVEIAESLSFWRNPSRLSEEKEAQLVFEYFDLIKEERLLLVKEERKEISPAELARIEVIQKEKNALERRVEKIIERQLTETLRIEGIENPFGKTSIFFPRVRFRLENMPERLVVAQRDALKEVTRVYLNPDTRIEDIENIEDKIADKGYSAIVVGIGGTSTYPSMVSPSSAHGAISTVAHEWVHHYLTFTPLRKSNHSKQKNIEETVATIIGRELRDIIWNKYYAPYVDELDNTLLSPASNKDINISEELRKTREKVEEYLKSGEVEKAEKYMAERRDWLEENGYYIRKLNQAYFVFYGYYATNPAYRDANGGIGQKLIDLRGLSASLKEFLLTVSEIRTIEDIDNRLAHLTK